MNTVRMYQFLGRVRRGLNLIIVGTYAVKALGISALSSAILIIITRWLGWTAAFVFSWLGLSFILSGFFIRKRAPKPLNLIWAGFVVIKGAGIAALISGVFILIARWLGEGNANLAGWCGMTISGGFGGLITGFRWKRLNEIEVARWIDTRFGFKEAITAALICIERGCLGLLDHAIVERAQMVTAEPLQIRWPLQHFSAQAIRAGILVGVSVLALILVPAQLGIHSRVVANQNQITSNLVTSPETTQRPRALNPPEAKEIAKMLFPQDPQLMIQVEKAIMAGDIDSLRELLRKAMVNPAPEYPDWTSPVAPQNLAGDLQNDQMIQSLIAADSMEDVRQIMDQNQDRQSRPSETEGQDRDQAAQELAQRQSSKESKQGGGKTPPNHENHLENQKPEPDQLRGWGTYAYNSALPGQEKETTKVAAKITPQSDSRKKPIILANKGGFFEYLLPGKDTQVPLAGVLPEAAQASEQALFTQRAPGEYADFTRSYFLKLSQFITDSPPEESEGKP